MSNQIGSNQIGEHPPWCDFRHVLGDTYVIQPGDVGPSLGIMFNCTCDECVPTLGAERPEGREGARRRRARRGAIVTKLWPATCATCGQPVRKAESHSGAPGSGVPVKHLACALPGAPAARSLRSCEHRDSGAA